MKSSEEQLRSLMLRSLGGDAASHNQLLRDLSLVFRSFFWHRCGGNPDDAEDLVQKTLIAVHTRRESYDPSRPFMSWAFSIARYKMIDEFRRRGTRPTLSIDEMEDFEEPGATDEHNAAVDAIDVDRLLSTLTPQQETAIRQVKLQGLSIEESAAQSGLSPSNVKISIHRGLRKLMAGVQKSDRGEN